MHARLDLTPSRASRPTVGGVTLPRLRHPADAEIFKLALPALGALAAEPLYVLVDTAMVGHLGTPQLAALALAGTLLTGAFTLFNFLTYGTTAQVSRMHGAGEEERAGRIAAQALWLSLAIGVTLLVVLAGVASPLIAAMGGTGHTGDLATTYLRIAALGMPFALSRSPGPATCAVSQTCGRRWSSSSSPTSSTSSSSCCSSTASTGAWRARRGRR